ncbi:methyltransferase domain-containing protein, partial [Candidatus Wolfebacteria bacterium]|nr:methyltransferase domain-containing protein [Candidatus Wolfebacteria bacterium]
MKNNNQKLHLGCGLNTPEGWLNVDGSWNAWLMKFSFLRKIIGKLKLIPQKQLNIAWKSDILIHDLRKLLPFNDNSFKVIYMSHLLEHFYLNEAKKLLKECFRVLKPGGILRVMVPDLEEMINNYIKKENNKEPKKEEELIAYNFMKGLNIREEKRLTTNFFYRIYKSVKDFHSHKWMYDEESLTFYFKKVGFCGVKKKGIHKSKIEDIENIEFNKGLCIEGL